MTITIDELYLGVVSLTARIPNSKERDDASVVAQAYYKNDDMNGLSKMYAQLKRLPSPFGFPTKKRYGRKVSLPPNVEASGMPDPKIYNYFSNYNSPLNTVPPQQITKPYPLYANFGAYDVKSMYI